MEREETDYIPLDEYRKHLVTLTEEENIKRDLHLKSLANGRLSGPLTGYPEIDKPNLAQYTDSEIKESISNKSIYEFSYERNSSKLDNDILIYYGKKIKTKTLFDRVDQVAALLVNDYGIKDGDVIVMALPTIPEAYYLFLAINKIGAIAEIIDPRFNEETLKKYIDKDCKLLFCISTYNEKFDHITAHATYKVISVSPADSLGFVMRFIYCVKTKSRKTKRFIEWKQFMQGANEHSLASIAVKAGQKDQVAARLYTSGTTGMPKLVNLTNKAINSVAFHQRKHMPDLEEGDRYLVIMPPFIAYGLVCGMCAPMSAAQQMILIPKFDPRNFSKIIMRYKPNHMLGVPAFYESMIKNRIFHNRDLSFIKYCIAGGDKMNMETEKSINSFFQSHHVKNKIVKGYGMTEVSSAAFSTPNNTQNKLGSVGIPYLKNMVRVVSLETGKNLTYNQQGEIYIFSPSMMAGYHNNQEETDKIIVNDRYGQKWIKTGDIGFVDNMGNTTINDRIKRMIVRTDGHNVFPSAIEAVINSHDAVENSVVIGLNGKESMSGKIPTAVIVLKEKYRDIQEKIEQEIKELSLNKLPPRDVALQYIFIPNLPLTPSGKIDVKKLEMEYKNFLY